MDELDRRSVDARTGQITYREAGSGPVVVFMHGLGGNSRTWEEQLSALSGECRVVAWDAPGYGGSALQEENEVAYAEAGLALFEALGIERATLVGHSMGGVVGVRLASIAPEKVERLVVSCSFLGDRVPAGGPLGSGYAKRIEDIDTLDIEDFARARAQGMVGSAASDRTRERVAKIATEINPDGFRAACRMLNHADNETAARSLSMPVLALSGDLDTVVPAARVDELAAAVPNCLRLHLDGVGHAPYLEDVAGYNAVLRDFMA